MAANSKTGRLKWRDFSWAEKTRIEQRILSTAGAM
jgi:hypothetical protein